MKMCVCGVCVRVCFAGVISIDDSMLQGLGNAFLSNINACDALFHVVRKLPISPALLSCDQSCDLVIGACGIGAFDDDDVTHVEGEVNPVRDLEIISEELRLKDVQYLAKNIVSLAVLFGSGMSHVSSLSLSWRRQW